MQSVTLTSVVRTAVLLRGDARHLLEQAVEVRIIVERQRRGDVFHRHVAGDEHQLRLFNLLLVDVLQGTDACLVLEEAAEVVLRQAGIVGQCVEVDHLVQVIVDVGDGRAHPFVLALYLLLRALDEVRQQLVDDAPRLYFVAEGALLVLHHVLQQCGVIVVRRRVGLRQTHVRIDGAESFEEVQVEFGTRNFHGHVPFIEEAAFLPVLFIYM